MGPPAHCAASSAARLDQVGALRHLGRNPKAPKSARARARHPKEGRGLDTKSNNFTTVIEASSNSTPRPRDSRIRGPFQLSLGWFHPQMGIKTVLTTTTRRHSTTPLAHITPPCTTTHHSPQDAESFPQGASETTTKYSALADLIPKGHRQPPSSLCWRATNPVVGVRTSRAPTSFEAPPSVSEPSGSSGQWGRRVAGGADNGGASQ